MKVTRIIDAISQEVNAKLKYLEQLSQPIYCSVRKAEQVILILENLPGLFCLEAPQPCFHIILIVNAFTKIMLV